MKKLFIAVIFSVIIFMSCSHEDSVVEPVIYTGGYFWDNSPIRACYWVNGVRHELDGISVRTITAVKGHVYTAGYYREGDTLKACYWENDIRHDLPGLIFGEDCMGRISVDSGNVYIGGITDGGVCYWINGIQQNPPSDGKMMLGIIATGGNVFIPGYYTKGSVIMACFWVNDIRNEMLGSEDFLAGIITVEENTICIVGYPRWFLDGKNGTHFNFCYWTYGYGQQYISPDYINAITVSEGNVYIANIKGCYINGEYHCDNTAGFYVEFAVSCGKVYTAGDNGYYVDGVFYEFDGYGYTYSIYVE